MKMLRIIFSLIAVISGSGLILPDQSEKPRLYVRAVGGNYYYITFEDYSAGACASGNTYCSYITIGGFIPPDADSIYSNQLLGYILTKKIEPYGPFEKKFIPF